MPICSQCCRDFSSQRRLDYHIQRKVCLKKQNGKKCPSCDKLFQSKQSCQYHIEHKVCQGKTPVSPTPSNESLPPPEMKSEDDNILTTMTKAEIYKAFTHLQGKYESLKENPQYINTNIIVFPDAFGKEDIDKIRQKLGDVCRMVLKNHATDSIPKLFDKIHKSDELPEYHNVYATSERSNYALVSDGKKFEYRPKKTVIDEIIESKRSILNTYIDVNGDQLGEKVLRAYERYQDRIDDDPEFRKTLEIEIGSMLLNMKSVIANDEKTRNLLDKVSEGLIDDI
jgi:hypothetical protein